MMNSDFPRLLTLLRKERNLSQKQAASDLGIAQALLSHYEKGKRECGLDFLVRAADYYNVSVDYLLGRSAVSTGEMISNDDLEDIADPEKARNLSPDELSSAFAKKLVTNSADVIFSLLAKTKNPALTDDIYDIFSFAVYRSLREIYKTNPLNDKNIFKVPEQTADLYINMGENAVCAKAAGDISQCRERPPVITGAALEADYGKKASVLLNLIMRCEDKIEKLRESCK